MTAALSLLALLLTLGVLGFGALGIGAWLIQTSFADAHPWLAGFAFYVVGSVALALVVLALVTVLP